MEFHPIANVFPMLPQEELESLAADIKENGLHHPVTTFEGMILDGRNRYVACELAGVECRFEEYQGDAPVAFVISENIARRHLDESQRSMCAARLANLKDGQRADYAGASIDAPVTQPQAAKLLNVSRPSVQRAKTVLEHGIPELVQLVDVGEIAVSRASEIAKELPEVQREKISVPHVAYNSGNNEWYTPPEYIEAAVRVMGKIDLDPASSDDANRIVGANKYYTIDNDGLKHKWTGKVWMNPPYASDLVGSFAGKLVSHVSSGDVTEAIVLVNNATETSWFCSVVGIASAVVFPTSRVRFLRPDGTTGAPLQGQAILYVGDNAKSFIKEFSRFGWAATVV